MVRKKINTYKYDAKSEKVFCESIPKGIKWQFQDNVHTWTYSEVVTKGNVSISKDATRKYTPDINFSTFDLELKGYLRPDAKKRMETLRKLDKDVDIRIAFQKNLPIRKGAKRKYLDWARINGYDACIASTYDELPEDWKVDTKKVKGKCKIK